MRCKLEEHADGIAVRTPFSRNFVYELKETIPSHERRWDAPSKLWIVSPKYGNDVQHLILRHFSENISVPDVKLAVEKHRGTIKLLYVGASKEREDGSSTSFGMHFDTKKWTVVFPQNVLENWFDGVTLERDINEKSLLPKGSYYLILGIKKVTDDQDEIKSAYRRMARQWHPDVCKEPDANDRFKIINEAYQLLSNLPKKRLYDIGQKMVNSAATTHKQQRNRFAIYNDYKPALRCGVIDCDYEVLMGRAFVQRIYSWNDIMDNTGRVLVTSWIMGNDEPTVAWV